MEITCDIAGEPRQQVQHGAAHATRYDPAPTSAATASCALNTTSTIRRGGVWVFRTVCFERVVLSSPGCLWPGRMDDHEEVLEAHA